MDALYYTAGVCLPIAIVAFALWKFWSGNSNSRLPPGPPGMPLIGNLFHVDTDSFPESLKELGKHYEDVFTLTFGCETVVVVKSIQAYRELHLLNGMAEKLAGRPVNFNTIYISESMDLVLSTYCPGFEKRRIVCQTAIKAFEANHEKEMIQEIGHVIDLLAKKVGEAQELETPICMFLVNICMFALTGRRLEYDDELMAKILEMNECIQSLILPKVAGILSKLPWLRHIPFGYGKICQRLEQLSKEQKEAIFNREKASFDPDKRRGAIDDMLKLQQSTDGETDSWLSNDHIWKSAASMIGGGIAAPTGNLLFFPIVIVRQPEVCLEIQKEVDRVIGRGRLPKLEDRDSMPYTQAVVLELLRYVSPTPTLIPRVAMEDVEFRNYLIPKGTTIMTNVWEIFHDEKLWDEPWKFRPERFLDQSGSLLPPTSEQRRNLIPFGSGKRYCIGGQLYMSEAFLFIVAMLQRFNFHAATGGIPPSDPHYHRESRAPIYPRFYNIVLKNRT